MLKTEVWEPFNSSLGLGELQEASTHDGIRLAGWKMGSREAREIPELSGEIWVRGVGQQGEGLAVSNQQSAVSSQPSAGSRQPSAESSKQTREHQRSSPTLPRTLLAQIQDRAENVLRGANHGTKNQRRA